MTEEHSIRRKEMNDDLLGRLKSFISKERDQLIEASTDVKLKDNEAVLISIGRLSTIIEYIDEALSGKHNLIIVGIFVTNYAHITADAVQDYLPGISRRLRKLYLDLLSGAYYD